MGFASPRNFTAPLPPTNRILSFAVSGGIMALIGWGALRFSPPIEKILPHQDKLEHMCAFGALTLWLMLSLGRTHKLLVATLAVTLAVLLEWAQAHLTTTREASLGDMVASTMGVVLATIFVVGAERIIRQRGYRAS